MAYNIRFMAKFRDSPYFDKVPMPHTAFTSDERAPEVVKAMFEHDNCGARFVEVFKAERAWARHEFPGRKIITEPMKAAKGRYNF